MNLSVASNRDGVIAAVGAGAMIATQVAGKAARDALFLANFDAAKLPAMVLGAALLSVVTMSVMIGLIARYGPQRTVPAAFGVSAVLLTLVALIAAVAPAIAAVLLYLHIGAVSAVLVSGFWSVVNERFDPHAARRTIGRIALGGTVGGLLGGLSALGGANHISFPVLLAALAVLQLVALALTRAIARPTSAPPRASTSGETSAGARLTITRGIETIASSPYLLAATGLVVVGTGAETFIDYVFKSEVQAALTNEASMLRFFATFYAATGFLTFAFQLVAGRRLLERFGLLPSLAALPMSVLGGSLLALFVPGLATVVIARGTEAVVQSSVYRSGYELLYVPIARQRKRTTKVLIDVGADRLGTVLGAVVVSVIIAVGLVPSRVPLLVGAAALAGLATWLTLRLRDGYVDALEGKMVDRAARLDLDGHGGVEVMETSPLLTLGELDFRAAISELEALSSEPPAPEPDAPDVGHPVDAPRTEALDPLSSGDPEAVRAHLRSADDLGVEAVPRLLELLAWDAVAQEVITALRPLADDAVRLLRTSLGTSSCDFAVRRRIPRVLSHATSQEALDALILGLDDRRFEVRFQCSHAAHRLKTANPHLHVQRDRVLDAVARELDVERGVWASYRLIDDHGDLGVDTEFPFTQDELLARSQRAQQHVFTLLALAYPDSELRTAYAVLNADDPTLRGTALEYLETLLPGPVHRRLIPFIEAPTSARGAPRPPEEALRALLGASQSLQTRLDDIASAGGDREGTAKKRNGLQS